MTLLLLLVGATSLWSCGGGGGGGGSGSLFFSIDRTQVSFDYPRDQPPPPQIVTITASGRYSGTLYISGSVSGPEIATPIPISVTGSTATVQIAVASELAAGGYSGKITLMACSDSACAHQLGNSPLSVGYSITVHGVLQVTPSTVSLNAVTGTTASQLVAVALPDGQSTFSTSVVSGSPWLSILNATASSFTIAAGARAPGSYTGQVTVTSGGVSTGVSVTYVVSAQPLEVTPSSVSFDVVSGSPASKAISVQLPTGQTGASASVISGSPWLTITDATASSFTITAASLPSGTYSGVVQVTSGTYAAGIVVTYKVTAPSGGDKQLAASPTSLTLATVEDATTSAALTVTPPSWNPRITATAEYPDGAPSGWLTLQPATGGEGVTANAATLSAGSYTANIRLHAAYPANDILVPVALTVGVGLVRPADVALSVNAETPQAALAGSVPVNVASGPATAFSAASNAPWLVLTAGSGQTGQSLSYRVDPAKVAALTGNQISTAQLTVTPSVTSMTPVSFNVQLTANLPQIQSLAPYTQLAGQPARVVLRGSGFSAITSPATRFAIDGLAPTAVSLVADTEAVAQFAALAAGAHTVSVSNALGVSTATGRVLTTNPPAYSYFALATARCARSPMTRSATRSTPPTPPASRS